MTLFDIILLFQVVLSGGVTISGGATVGVVTTDIAATDCATVTQAAWDGFGMPFDPYEVTATNTQISDGCAGASVQFPTVSLP